MSRPPNVGILAIEVYLPTFLVRASDLERHDGVVGKYTEGLGQAALGFVTDAEDAVSLALTCVHSLLEKYAVDAQRIGRLEVGSESNPDRCKSIKSHLMRLLGAAGNNDVEGVDSVHGCYGATAALLNAVNWVESSSWDGRLALVVGTDVAAYAPGTPSRATGGAGAVCLLVGANAPLVADPAWRASYAAHASEFCKPAACGPFPVFDGAASLHHYMASLDHAYLHLFKRLNRLQQRVLELQAQGRPGLVACFDVSAGILPHVDYFIAHAPFARLVRRAFARLALHDALRTAEGAEALAAAGVAPRWQMMEPDALPGVGYGDKALDKALASACGHALAEKVETALRVQAQVGNLYCASLYCGLAALWEAQGVALDGRRLLLYSFGSGTQGSLLSFVGRSVPGGEFTLERVAAVMGLSQRLAARVPRPPAEYDSVLSQLQDSWGAVPFTPATPPAALPPGSWYLQHVTEQHVRQYERVPPNMGGGQNGGGPGGRGGQPGSGAGSPMPCSSEPTTALGSSLDAQGGMA